MANAYVCVDVYTVKSGDTLYSISQRYDVPVGLLMRVNQINNPYNLRIGRKLCIPGKYTPDPGEADRPQCKGTLHTVQEGDTLYMIAKKHKVTLDALMDANPDIDPYNMTIGMELCIPR